MSLIGAIFWMIAACGVIEAGTDYHGILPPSVRPATARARPTAPRPSPTATPAPAGPVAFAGRWENLFFRIVPVEAADLIRERSLAENRARKNLRFVPLLIVNETAGAYRWIDGHDTAVITLRGGEMLTSEDPTLLMKGSSYPWGYAHVADLVASRAEVPPGGEALKFLAFRGEFEYGDIESAQLVLGMHTVEMARVAIKKSPTPHRRLQMQNWKQLPIKRKR